MDEVIAAANLCGYRAASAAAAVEQMKRTETHGCIQAVDPDGFRSRKVRSKSKLSGASLCAAPRRRVRRLPQLQCSTPHLRSARSGAPAGSRDAMTSAGAIRGPPPSSGAQSRSANFASIFAALASVSRNALCGFVSRCPAERPRRPVLRSLREISVLLVSDRRMAALHQQFLDIPGRPM